MAETLSVVEELVEVAVPAVVGEETRTAQSVGSVKGVWRVGSEEAQVEAVAQVVGMEHSW